MPYKGDIEVEQPKPEVIKTEYRLGDLGPLRLEDLTTPEPLGQPIRLEDLTSSGRMLPPTRPTLPPLSLDANTPISTIAAQELVKEWFALYPGMTNLQVHPIINGTADARYVLGLRGEIYLTSNGHRVRPANID